MDIAKKETKSLAKSKMKKDALFFACLVAVPTLNFLVLYIGVNFNSILLAFQKYNPETLKMEYNSVANFERVFNEFSTLPTFKTALSNSLIASLFTVGVSICIALVFSLYIYHKQWGHKVFKVILFVPSIISSIVMVKMYAMFCDEALPDLIEMMFKVTKVKGLLANLDTRWGAIIFFNLWSGFGSSILIYVGGMNNISDSVSEAAKLDGVNVLQETWYITLPLIYPTLLTFVTAGLTGVFTNQLGLYSFWGDAADSNVITVGYWLYREVARAQGQMATYPYIAAVGLLCTVVCIPVTFFVRWLMNKLGPKVE